MICPKGHIVTNTTINHFVNSGTGCFKCNVQKILERSL